MAGKQYSCVERFCLLYVHAFHKAVFHKLRNNYARTVIPQPACVYVCRLEIVTNCVHRHEWGITALVSEIVAEFPAREFGACFRFCSNKFCFLAFEYIVPHERECKSAEIRTSAEAGYYRVGIFACHFHLFFCFKSYYRLMQRYMVEHRA